MKKSLIATLAAATLLSPVAFAAEPVELSAAQMDGVTAGYLDFNIAPNIQTITQTAVALNFGNHGHAVADNDAYQRNFVIQHQ
ncbi:MAG TPA: hypothetical protein VF427_03740 [Noviherbaspirillum sp.]